MQPPPFISIIIPVYNVESYLRDCLDSVVNQTMREIQIICVNDGSTDNSLNILNEYAKCDSRIEIIDKLNGGLSSARNAAYPHIKGKYTLFVDSDDWIEYDLCEKTYQKAETTNAEIVVFYFQIPFDAKSETLAMLNGITPEDKITNKEKQTIINYPTAWGKLWKSDFLLDNKLFFPEGLCFEDNLVHWKGVILANKISILQKPLYYYRQRNDSITSKNGLERYDLFKIFSMFFDFLKSHNEYESFIKIFLRLKIDLLFNTYQKIDKERRPKFLDEIKKTVSKYEIDYMRSERYIDYSVTYFYYSITGDWRIFLMYLRRRIRSFLGTSKRNIINFFKTLIIKNKKKS
ncbi:MAG: glycosyltransferase family 2 protein [Planctomycetaceae bacterium]|jgi:glycosyltransferase involved in cell wall biosynthesis|nr:glycosyltransferase family 2 protein [Planctomycetaceae bacterium]